MRIRQFVIDGLGHLSTLISDDSAGVAAVIDPRRDVDVYLEAADEAGITITHVVETHLHNDYVSGGRELAALTGRPTSSGQGPGWLRRTGRCGMATPSTWGRFASPSSTRRVTRRST